MASYSSAVLLAWRVLGVSLFFIRCRFLAEALRALFTVRDTLLTYFQVSFQQEGAEIRDGKEGI